MKRSLQDGTRGAEVSDPVVSRATSSTEGGPPVRRSYYPFFNAARPANVVAETHADARKGGNRAAEPPSGYETDGLGEEISGVPAQHQKEDLDIDAVIQSVSEARYAQEYAQRGLRSRAPQTLDSNEGPGSQNRIPEVPREPVSQMFDRLMEMRKKEEEETSYRQACLDHEAELKRLREETAIKRKSSPPTRISRADYGEELMNCMLSRLAKMQIIHIERKKVHRERDSFPPFDSQQQQEEEKQRQKSLHSNDSTTRHETEESSVRQTVTSAENTRTAKSTGGIAHISAGDSRESSSAVEISSRVIPASATSNSVNYGPPSATTGRLHAEIITARERFAKDLFRVIITAEDNIMLPQFLHYSNGMNANFGRDHATEVEERRFARFMRVFNTFMNMEGFAKFQKKLVRCLQASSLESVINDPVSVERAAARHLLNPKRGKRKKLNQFLAPRRFGKSTALMWACVFYLIFFPNYSILFVSIYQPECKRIANSIKEKILALGVLKLHSSTSHQMTFESLYDPTDHRTFSFFSGHGASGVSIAPLYDRTRRPRF